MPRTMKAALLTQVDHPWEFQDVPQPSPKNGQVVIRVHACGMCGTDVHYHRGQLSVPLPIVLGHEPVGEIVEVGFGVSEVRVGDRVGVSWAQKGCGQCRFCQGGRTNFCKDRQTWVHTGGGYCEYMLAWGSGCTRIPDGLSYESAAPIFCAGFTVMSGLRNADPQKGERIAVLGIGGLGHLAIQFCKALGFETIAVTASESKMKEAKELGADEVLVVRKHTGEELLAAGGADIILSTTSSARQVSEAMAGLKPDGRLISMGLLDRPIEVDSFSLLVNGRKLIGSKQNYRKDLEEALALAAQGKVKPKIEVYPWEKINEVRDRLEAGKVRYRAVLKIAD